MLLRGGCGCIEGVCEHRSDVGIVFPKKENHIGSEIEARGGYYVEVTHELPATNYKLFATCCVILRLIPVATTSPSSELVLYVSSV